MHLGRCPTCHRRLDLEAIIEDDAARELAALVTGLDQPLAAPLVAYLGLFRSPSRDLANDRALRLARETLALNPNQDILAAALSETVESLRRKRDAGTTKPLTKHAYIESVIETIAARWTAGNVLAPQAHQAAAAAAAPSSKTGQAISDLEAMKHGR